MEGRLENERGRKRGQVKKKGCRGEMKGKGREWGK